MRDWLNLAGIDISPFSDLEVALERNSSLGIGLFQTGRTIPTFQIYIANGKPADKAERSFLARIDDFPPSNMDPCQALVDSG